MATITRRGKKWQVKVRIAGLPPKSATFDTYDQAKRWAAITETDLKERKFFGRSYQSHDFSELFNIWLSDAKKRLKPKTLNSNDAVFRYWHNQLGNVALTSINAYFILNIIKTDPRFKTYGNYTILQYLAYLSSMFSMAVALGWVDKNPVSDVPKPQLPKGRVRYLTKDEITALLNACKASKSKDLYVIVVLALSTGMRKGEILGLTWDRVSGNSILLVETKNQERRVVHLVGLAKTLLDERRPKEPSKDKVFTVSTLEKSWIHARAKAQLVDFRFHDLRHTCASYLAMNGESLLTIAQILGHKNITMTQRYAHLSSEHTKTSVNKLNSTLFGGESQ